MAIATVEDGFLKLADEPGEVWATEEGAPFPGAVCRWLDGGGLELSDGGTWMVFFESGRCLVELPNGRSFMMAPGMYAMIPGAARMKGGSGLAVVLDEFDGLFTIGGPVEETGRLKYIDGCTDTLLIAPIKMGDPCLNLLHIPPRTAQSAHTHPSYRVGLILSGTGKCVTPNGETDLYPGVSFVIPEGSEHSFHTDGEALRVLAYHPDSDFGPTDEVHPMRNGTHLKK